MMPASAASLMRPASLKNKKETKLADDAEGDVDGVVLDPELLTNEGDSAANDAYQYSRKRKAVEPVPRLAPVPRLPHIQRKQFKV